MGKKYLYIPITSLVAGPGVAAHASVLLLSRQGFQDNVGGPEARQCDMGQVRERVFLCKQLAGFSPLPEEAALREEHYPLPVTAVVVLF